MLFYDRKMEDDTVAQAYVTVVSANTACGLSILQWQSRQYIVAVHCGSTWGYCGGTSASSPSWNQALPLGVPGTGPRGPGRAKQAVWGSAI